MGLTENGLVVRTQPELQTLLEDAVTAAIPGIDLSQGPEHQVIGILSEELAIAWEALQALYAALYPDSATGVSLDQVAALTGTVRRQATKSRVAVTVRLGAGKTLPAGSVAAVNGAPDDQFELVAAVTNSGASEADVAAVFEALVAGPVAAPPSTLTVIVTPISGWVSITNAAAAVLGQPVATDAELRVQRVIELAGAGRGTLASIRAAVARITTVESVSAYENTSVSPDGAGRPGKSFEVVVWGGDPPPADNDAIAQAIWNTKPAAIEAYGGASGTAVDAETGEAKTVWFTRAAKLRIYVTVQVVLKPGVGAGWQASVQAAVAARGDLYAVGAKAYASHLSCAILDALPAVVEAVSVLTLGTIAPGSGSIVTPTYSQIVRIAFADVTVSEAP